MAIEMTVGQAALARWGRVGGPQIEWNALIYATATGNFPETICLLGRLESWGKNQAQRAADRIDITDVGQSISDINAGKAKDTVARWLKDYEAARGVEDRIAGDMQQALRDWRGEATQAQAALALGVSLRTYQGWEAGRPVSDATLALLNIAIANTRP